MEPRFQRSQFRAGNNGASLRFVSSGSPGAKWHDVATLPRFHAITPEEAMGAGTTSDMRAILAGLLLCSAFAVGDAQPSSRLSRRRAEDIARGKALTDAGDCASCHTADPAKPFAGGKRIDTPFGAHLFAQPDPGPRYRPRRVERRRFLPRAALRRGARRLALLPGVPLPEFHKTDPRGHSGDPRLSRDAGAGPQHAAAAGTALAAELSRRDARLELAVLQARHHAAGPAKERGMESRPLSGRGRRRIAAPAIRRRTFLAPTDAARPSAAGACRACSRRGSMAPSAAG